ncbi:MAG TPA: S9 family peptidase [Gemmataceae bacterium]|nr:S9 family peptidase [Gemmataceae bacterium]
MRAFLLTAAVLVLAAPATVAQSDVIKPGDNLVTDGIPPVPAELAEKVARYTEFRSASLTSWHPTRREMLISTRFGQSSQVHRVKMPGGARFQLTFYPDSVSGASYEPSNGDYFVFGKGSGGNERFQLYRYDFATGDVTLFTDGKSRNTPGPWATAGGRMAYTSTRRNNRDFDIWVINPAEPKSDKLLLQVEGAWHPIDWSPDDDRLLVGQSISANESYLHVVDVKSGKKTELTPKGPEKVSYTGGRFAKDGKSIFVTTDKDSEFHRLARINLESGKHAFLTDDIKWDVEEFELSPDGKTIAFVANEDGVGKLHLIEADTGKQKLVRKLPPGSVGGLEWHKNGKDLGLGITSARSPADVYSLDIESGNIERWTECETGGLNTQTFAEPELIKWKTFDGRMISGFLYRPPAKFPGKRPVVINIHGGPEGQFQPTFLGRNNYFLNELGVALLFPNVRGSTGYGKTFLTLDNGFKREDSYKDIESLLDWLKTRDDLDAERVMVTGGSYGGFMTLAVACNYADRIRCAVDVVGISNFVTFLQNTESYRRDLRRVEYGDERDPKMREFMQRTAPVNNVHKIKRPMFIVQGKNDPRVPLSEAEQMVAALKRANVPVWYLIAKDEGHGFAKKANADFQFYATVLFMQEHLLK